MKIRRYKKVNRYMAFYVNNFGFRLPYQLLLDGTICYSALNNKINISNNIPRYLQSELKVLTTQCAIIEVEKLGPKLNGALLILKQYGIHKCGHEGKPITAAKCILSMVGRRNEKHYIVATQDRDLQQKLKNVPGVPLIYLHSKTPVLDPPSQASNNYSRDKPDDLVKSEMQVLKTGLVENERRAKKRKKKGANPLSCLKNKKKKPEEHNRLVRRESKRNEEKSNRKRIRIAKHVKEELTKK